MEDLGTDISYLLGCYVGIGRTIEKTLDRMIKKETPSTIEGLLGEFTENPATALRSCQDAIIKEQMVLKHIDKSELIEESAEILKMIKIDVLEHITIDTPNFLHGYHTIQKQHGVL